MGNTNSAFLSRSQITISPDLMKYITTNYVNLAYDDDNKMIRITPSESGLKYYQGKIGAIGFYKAFKIKLVGQFEARYNLADDAILIYL
jgi:hypothetical protein